MLPLFLFGFGLGLVVLYANTSRDHQGAGGAVPHAGHHDGGAPVPGWGGVVIEAVPMLLSTRVDTACILPGVPIEVADVQRRLARIGFSVGETGICDEATHDAILEFQEQHGLTTSGRVDASTEIYLRSLTPNKVPERPDWISEDRA